jgi:hypothetical protein
MTSRAAQVLRVLFLIPVLAFLSSWLITAQQPKQLQRAAVKRQLPLRSVTVVDIRTATAPVAKLRAAGDPRAVIAPLMAGQVAPALTTAQLKGMLSDAGIQNTSPSGEYARFGPGRLSADGKGYMMLQAPLWVDPFQIQFDGTLDENQWLAIASGPKIRLQEGGAFVLDFLFDVPAADPGKTYRCDVIKDNDVLQQINFTEDTPGPQHLLVVFQQGQPDPPTSGPLIGIRIRNAGPEAHPDWIRWSLFQVVVTKL